MPADANLAPERRAGRGRVSRLGFGGAHLNEYFGVWSIDPTHGQALADRASRLNLRLHVAQQEAAEQEHEQQSNALQPSSAFGEGYGETLMEDGTAVIRMEGTLMKFAGSMSRGMGTVALRRTVRRAKASASVARVMVVIDSPGGTVAGTQALAEDLRELAATKPVHVFVEDLMASAALWVGSQGAVISAGPTSLVGSIGTFMAVADFSKAAAKEGVKVHLITTGKFKGAGTVGTKVSPEQLAEWQRVVDGLNAHFLDAVGKGRRLPAAKVSELADGRVHVAEEARKLGLIDHVESLDAAMQRLRGAAPVKNGARAEDDTTTQTEQQEAAPAAEQTMSQQQTTTAAAPTTPAPPRRPSRPRSSSSSRPRTSRSPPRSAS